MKKVLLFSVICLMVACSGKNKKSDAYGNFESTEVIVSSEVAGKILKFSVEEGTAIKAGVTTGYVDTTDLVLKKEQLMAQRDIISVKTSNINSQIDVQKQQKANLMIDKARIEKLYKDGAATKKQVDDINGSINLVDKQINSIETQNSSVLNELKNIDRQIDQVNENISKCYIVNPINGTVLNKYAEESEFTTMGKALYKIADMDYLDLRVYASGAQLPNIKIGQKVEVLIDKNAYEFTKLEGTVTWISSTAEFTPKIIQTKEDRVNLVYAVKVKVKNDGSLKIGMPGEVNFK
jgi:HlyD family secretion protein